MPNVIDGKICKTASSSPNQDEADKCTKGSSGYGSTGTGLLAFTSEKNNSSIFSTNDTKLSAVPKATKTISTEISNLNKDQKVVVSSAFAKADASSNNMGQDIHQRCISVSKEGRWR